MNIEITDRSYNVLWPCYVCEKKKTTKDKINIITVVAGIQVTGTQVRPVMQPNTCCDDCFKKLKLADTPPPIIHLAQKPISQKDISNLMNGKHL